MFVDGDSIKQQLMEPNQKVNFLNHQRNQQHINFSQVLSEPSTDKFLQTILPNLKVTTEKVKSQLQENFKIFVENLKTKQQLIFVPNLMKKTGLPLLQIFELKSNKKLIAYKSKQINNEQNEPNQSKVVFLCEKNLCINSLLVLMTEKQVVNICLGLEEQEWIRKQGWKTISSKQEQPHIYPLVNKLIQSFRQGGIENQKRLPFCRLSSFSICINLNSLHTNQECIFMLQQAQIILSFIEREQMLQLEKLKIQINNSKQTLSESQNNLIGIIYQAICNILMSKLKDEDSSGYFPKLSEISFNPEFFFDNQRVHLILSKKIDQSEFFSARQNGCKPFSTLNLISIPSKINISQHLQNLLNLIFPYFPCLINLVIKMKNGKLFEKFNEMMSCLYKFCPMIQNLKIENCGEQDRKEGLRQILRSYPYLANLKLVGTVMEMSNSEQFKYIKQILLRRIQIQRMLNIFKLMQKKGYTTEQCIGVAEIYKPFDSL